MIYGKPHNPYKTSALKRRPANAPINRLINSRGYQDGGLAGMRQMMTTGEEGLEIDWAAARAAEERRGAQQRTTEAAEKRLREMQKKSEKPWWQKLIETVITVANPAVGAVLKGMSTYDKARRTHKTAEEIHEDYKGSFLDETLEGVVETAHDVKGKAPLTDFFTSLGLSAMGGGFDKAVPGTEEALKGGVEAGGDLGALTEVGGEELLSGTLTEAGGEAGKNWAKDLAQTGMDMTGIGLNPQVAALTGLLKKFNIPGIEKVQGGIPFALNELFQPKLDKINLGQPWKQISPSGSQILRGRR